MPIFDYECECGTIFEFLKIKSDEEPVCPKCGSTVAAKVFSMMPNIRMDPDTILKSMPDPSPPLEELRGKTRKGCVGGYEDKPHADTNLKNYNRTKDKYGNSIWREKRRTYFHPGEHSKKSSAEKQ